MVRRVATLMFEQGNGTGLGRLNEAERQVLLLLAEGHTAKSVANELGSTPAAVNERLREARRKTGVGSSRELARLLKSQEIRHDELGIVSTSAAGAAPPLGNARSRRSRTGVVTMVFISLVAAAGAAALFAGQAPLKEVDPLLGTPLQTGPDPAALHAQVRAERRDPEWASKTEVAARARLLQISPVGTAGNELRVLCAATLCEFAGTFLQPEPAPSKYDADTPVNRAVSDLQGKSLSDDFSKLGLKSESGSFLVGKGEPSRLVFLLYYSRVK
jgi:DNA-binding CsgD family transcriptional regulator